ncbi:YceH family protein [Coraliomargarita sp. SDUM461004]|uniref:YceH family protein n=1 Tax=Thalassobacterium sedimentorum TaxID=3041258 RepID=A0ABU1AM23_9BACT|nr:YceH family protein [Coraliomargarita sp. SDUM461004]MDQ8195855.1 YceH family protein [Coraliomargarita sp. SDUM461004]
MDNETYPLLTAVDARVLGCLLEKAATTPDAYPLTLNSLLLACNQKSNRQPVVEYDEETVLESIDDLRKAKLVFRVDVAGSRVAKYRHNIDEHLGLDKAGKALLTVLLLRGAQTLGELRTRCERMHSFATTDEVEATLNEISEDVDRPLWTQLPRSPGKKELRYQHLLSGEPAAAETENAGDQAVVHTPSPLSSRDARIQELETTVETLQSELNELKAAFENFQKQFQ